MIASAKMTVAAMKVQRLARPSGIGNEPSPDCLRPSAWV
jgi:hypothetical protein